MLTKMCFFFFDKNGSSSIKQSSRSNQVAQKQREKSNERKSEARINRSSKQSLEESESSTHSHHLRIIMRINFSADFLKS